MEEGKETALLFLSVVESLAMAGFGEDAALLAHEKSMIEPALTRTLARYADRLGSVDAVLDPMMLLIGFTLWGGRLLKLRRKEKERQPKEDRPGPPAGEDTPAAPEAIGNVL